MAEQQPSIDQLVEVLQDRNINCSKLKNLEKRYRKIASDAGHYGMSGTMGNTEQIANKLKAVRKGVCKLK